VTLRAAALVALLAPAAAGAAGRFAVVAGTNEGAPGRPRLWFAEKDAGRFRATLAELGGFSDERIATVRGPSVDAFRDALAVTEAKVAAARARGEATLLVVYFSGHAGPGGLEFGRDRLGYPELREVVARSSADARVVIVDACEAGALTQVKGATASAAVDFPIPDANVEGTAFIASTALGEAAQESAQLGGSFFTHHLDVALRGAGDADGDGQVTLAEAFRYTAARTVAATTATAQGPQHPTYDFRMSGRGEVVLADLRRAEAHVRLPADPGSLYLLRGARQWQAEVQSGPDPLRLAVPAGRVEVERRSREGRARGALTLAQGDDRALPLLEPTRYEVARSKGGPLSTEAFAGIGAQRVPLPSGGVAPSVRAGVRREAGPAGLVLAVEYAGRDVRDRSIAYTWSRLGVEGTALLPIAGARHLLEGGFFAGYGWTTQTLRDRRAFSAGDLSAGLALRASLPVGRLRAALDLSGGVRAFELDAARVVRPVAAGALVLLYGF
jgi:hypothetical protein